MERSLFEDTTAEKQSAPTLPPDPAAEELWEQVLQDAEDDIEEDVSSLRVWFDGITPVGLQEDVLSIAVPNTFAKEYIKSRFGEFIESLLKKRLSEKASLLVVVSSAPNDRPG
jgi:chromosomal replication initiator protein